MGEQMKAISYIDNLLEWQQAFSFRIPIKIRFSETDMFGHVNNVSPFIYFEEARIEFMKMIGLFGDLDNPTGVPVVADLQCDYHKQMYFGESIDMYVKANHVGNTSFDLHYMAINEEKEICLTGRGRIVHIHPNDGKPLPMDKDMIHKLMATNK
ncbi:acyl-CoA thioesterase [Ornithinibacillus gellani]|uniref:acyl-CoA thioesterase n=1 Tax=Ornithinibacillus gellani TaxID=2293253 RepID=UPI0029583537|nr:thioesterase family protein [Ornithinibacillus gellani]